ncbi:hypothetical protein JOC34_000443 [Virgibacillus halotolerans]|uniref:hypothetical protein n=1 Tax=Virgibacillus halotolerans TaxID=1071053 RepID=UPI00195F59B1|nr:hypothetical protein [Virgibacillus halotolerans]MBM7598086.1 hypothetical protein [Virgibacillus halotolerans]
MARNFSNLNDLFAAIQSDMEDVMNQDVLPSTSQVMSEKTQTEVYDAYDPYQHQRRGASGGLADPSNVVGTVIDRTGYGMTMLIQNITKGANSGQPIAGLIEHGDSNGHGEYDWKTNRSNTAYKYLQPRRFMFESVRHMQLTLSHVKAMKSGLRARGYTIK